MGFGALGSIGGMGKSIGGSLMNSPRHLGQDFANGMKDPGGSLRNIGGLGVGAIKGVGSVGLSVGHSLHQVGKMGIGGLGSLAKGLGELGGLELGVEGERDTTIRGALTQYMRQCGRIEVQRADSASSRSGKRLERVYFRIPEYCSMLTAATREELRWGLSELTPEVKLQKFVEAADDCEGEMKWQKKLDQIKLYQVLNKRTYTADGAAKQRLELWKKITNYLAYLINLLIVLGYEHEDKYWSYPEPWTDWRFSVVGYEVHLG